MKSISPQSVAAHRALAVFAISLFAVSSHTAAQEQTAAVYKLHELDFLYRSSTAIFSCHELENRVAVIMRAVGARDNVQVKASPCDAFVGNTIEQRTNPFPTTERYRTDMDPFGTQAGRFGDSQSRTDLEQSARIRVSVQMPTEVTEKVLEEVKKDKSRRELISRVTGNPAAAFDDPIIFPAQRQEVTLSRKSIGLDPEDCELLEQVSTTLFRKLDVDVVHRSFHCSRNTVSNIPPSVTVKSLMPVLPSGPVPDPRPASGEDGEGASDTGESSPQEAQTKQD